MNKQKILILGGSGFLGSKLTLQHMKYDILAPSHAELNLLMIEKVFKFIEKTSPSRIVYLAGLTKIDDAEINEDLAFTLNANIPGQIAKFVAKEKINFFYTSSDAVFDGYKTKFIFSETDTPKAKSIYGKSKLKGEELVLLANADNTVIRLITLFGIDNTHKNFITRILKDLQENRSVLGITDQIQNPLLVNIATEAIAHIINKQLTGIYHLGSTDFISNYNFLIALAQKFNMDTTLINKITYSEFFGDKCSYRKQKSILLCDKFIKVSQNKILKTIISSLDYLYEKNPQFLSQ